MTRMISWFLAAFAALAAGTAVFVVMRRTPAAPAADGELARRLERLESSVPRLERTMVRTGAQLGTLALAGAKLPDVEEDDTPETAERRRQRERERAERESRYYDQLDGMARAGGGGAVEVQLRRNVAAAREQGGPALELQTVACGPDVCRVEVKATSATTTRGVVRTLVRGMGGLSMRPLGQGPAVYYVAAPDRQLPRMDQ